ncbi:hypothetical protein COOONC_20699 [Cooperia oncophora]
MAGVALIFTLLRGLTWPLFSIVYGKLFLLLSNPDPEALAEGNVLNSIFFLLLAIGSGICTFASGSMFGITGEKMAMRLRMDVFKVSDKKTHQKPWCQALYSQLLSLRREWDIQTSETTIRVVSKLKRDILALFKLLR